MANKSLFSSFKNRLTRADACNEAGGPAYRLPPKHALAQFAATGCFGGVYYASAESQLAELRSPDRPGRRQRLPGPSGGL